MVGGAAYYAGRKVAQGDQRESEQIDVEPDCRVQICREDLKTQAG